MKVIYVYVKKPGTDAEELKAKVLEHFQEHKTLYVAAYIAALNTALPSEVVASNGLSGGISLIKLMQGASFWIGLGVSIWGIVEAQLDYPGWKGRVMKGVLGYIAILLLPLIFLEIRDNLQVDIWKQIEGGN